MTQFTTLRIHAIPALQATLEDYVAIETGARHLHLRTQGADMAFLVALPTLPASGDGRAHILEHMVLCGSRRYPVRAPFFAMLRRSTASFMNAFTYADRTVYPFCTSDDKDFANLLDVYLDAVFFPNLDYLDFLQEGWRYTLTDGTLGYQGVVFNEMKGALAAPGHALYRGVVSTLLHGTTYAVESGGDPLVIPSLTHAMLKDFHARHYHPSQALFMSAGPMPAAAIQRRVADRVLDAMPGKRPRRMLQRAAMPTAARRNVIAIPSGVARPDDFGVQLAWSMGDAADVDASFDARLMSAGLMGDAAAPLRKAMESAGYGRPSTLNGYDDSARQMLYHVGMEGLTEPQVDTAEALLLAALERAARDGVPAARLRAALRNLTYRQRDTANRGMPNVLQRLLDAVPVALRDGDVVAAFDPGPVLARLDRRIADPAYFPGLVRALLAVPGRLVSKIVPDATILAAREAEERRRLAECAAALTEGERARIRRETTALEAYQRRPSGDAALPCIRPGDLGMLPPALPLVDPAGGAVHAFCIGSNGISSAYVVYDVSDFPEQDWHWLTLYADMLADLGAMEHGYEAAAAWRQRMVPAFGAYLQAVQTPSGALRLDLACAASCLREEHAGLVAVVKAYVVQPRFDEHARLGFLIGQMAQATFGSLADAGSRYAALAAGAPLAAACRFAHRTRGAAALPFYADLQRQAATPEGRARIAAELTRVHAALRARRPSILCAGSGSDGAGLAHMMATALPAPLPASRLAGMPTGSGTGMASANAALHAPGPVNHCSIAWSVPQIHDDDAAPLAVAAELLTSEMLHPALREGGGAYGGHAEYDGDVGVFSMASYRDPRLAGTYADFTRAVERVMLGDYPAGRVEQAILGAVKKIDQPYSPIGTVQAAWNLYRRGVDNATRLRFRRCVLGCTGAALEAAVRRWLAPGVASRAAFVGNTAQDLAGLDLVDLASLAA